MSKDSASATGLSGERICRAHTAVVHVTSSCANDTSTITSTRYSYEYCFCRAAVECDTAVFVCTPYEIRQPFSLSVPGSRQVRGRKECTQLSRPFNMRRNRIAMIMESHVSTRNDTRYIFDYKYIKILAAVTKIKYSRTSVLLSRECILVFFYTSYLLYTYSSWCDTCVLACLAWFQ